MNYTVKERKVLDYFRTRTLPPSIYTMIGESFSIKYSHVGQMSFNCLAGGALRDTLLGVDVSDVDIFSIVGEPCLHMLCTNVSKSFHSPIKFLIDPREYDFVMHLSDEPLRDDDLEFVPCTPESGSHLASLEEGREFISFRSIEDGVLGVLNLTFVAGQSIKDLISRFELDISKVYMPLCPEEYMVLTDEFKYCVDNKVLSRAGANPSSKYVQKIHKKYPTYSLENHNELD